VVISGNLLRKFRGDQGRTNFNLNRAWLDIKGRRSKRKDLAVHNLGGRSKHSEKGPSKSLSPIVVTKRVLRGHGGAIRQTVDNTKTGASIEKGKRGSNSPMTKERNGKGCRAHYQTSEGSSTSRLGAKISELCEK